MSLRLQQETRIHTRVTYRGEKIWLNGKADYRLWYGLYGEMECNLTIVEAKRIGENSHGGNLMRLNPNRLFLIMSICQEEIRNLVTWQVMTPLSPDGSILTVRDSRTCKDPSEIGFPA